MPELYEHREMIEELFSFFENHKEEFGDLREWTAYNIFCTLTDYLVSGDIAKAKQFARDYLKAKCKEEKKAFNGEGFL